LKKCVSQLQQKHEHEEQMMKGYTVVMVGTAKESMENFKLKVIVIVSQIFKDTYRVPRGKNAAVSSI
jgi:hypothetical protein